MPITTWTVIAVVPWNPNNHGDKVQPLFPLRKCCKGSDGKDCDDNASDPGILRRSSSRKSENPRRENQHRPENQVRQVAIFFIRPHVHGSSFREPMQTLSAPMPIVKREKRLPMSPRCKRKSERLVPFGPLQGRLAWLASGRLPCVVGRRLRRSRRFRDHPHGGLMRKHRRPPPFRSRQNVPGQVGFIHLCSPKLRLFADLTGQGAAGSKSRISTKGLKPGGGGWIVCSPRTRSGRVLEPGETGAGHLRHRDVSNCSWFIMVL